MPRLLPRFSRPAWTTRRFWASKASTNKTGANSAWTDRAVWTTRLYDLQQRLAITTTEATALLTLAGLLVLGLGVRAWQAQQIPFDDAFYAETDATFAALSGAPGHAPVAAPPSAASIVARLRASADTVRAASETPVAEPVAEATPPRSRSTRAAAGPVRMNVNTASVRLLDRLPGIGPALAERIIAYRAEHGDFQRTEDLVHVRGIGPKTFERLAAYVFVETETVEAEAQDEDPIAANVDGT
ncbi:MAG: helix-hairpin-helix domain-containing protein [Bacteroidota bacterium]